MLILIGFIGLVVYLQLIDVTVKLSHVRSATITYNGITIARADSSKPVQFKAPRNATIVVSYVGDDTFESSSHTIKTTTKPLVVSFTPYYTNEELRKHVQQEFSTISGAISRYNETTPHLYTVRDIKLYHYADWASAKLTWNGDETDSSDTLRVVLRRNGSSWNVVNKPNILLFRGYYTGVPIDVLRDTNNR